MKLMKSCARFLRKHGGTLLAIGASVGVVLTAIETGKATIKAEKLVELNKDVPEYDMKEKVKDCWHFYIPAAVLGAGTIGCIIGSNMLSRKEIASLSAAYVALGKSYQEYRRQVAERIGVEEEEKLRMEAAKETKAEDVQRDKDGDVIRLFYEPASKRYFHATMSRVIEASYYFNRELATNGCISVNEWCNYLCADELTITPEGDQMGWCLDQLVYDWDGGDCDRTDGTQGRDPLEKSKWIRNCPRTDPVEPGCGGGREDPWRAHRPGGRVREGHTSRMVCRSL